MKKPALRHVLDKLDCMPNASPPPDLQILRAADVAQRPVDWLWPGRIPIGKVTLLVGDPGMGKSLVALDVAARVSRGESWPDEQVESQKIRVQGQNSASGSPLSTLDSRLRGSAVVLSAEDDLADTIRPRLEAGGADCERVFVLPGLADLRVDFDQLQAAIDRLSDCRLIVIDPINAYVGATDAHFHTVVRKVLAPLAKFAAKKRMAVLAVTHLRKLEGAAIYRATGSMGFVAAARAVWAVCPDRNHPGRSLLVPVKNNLAPDTSGLAYAVERHAQLASPVVRWQGEVSKLTADEALSPKPRGPEAEERLAAAEWLRQVLASGPQNAFNLIEEGKERGFEIRTLQRAFHSIGGITEKTDFLLGWRWTLPGAETNGHTGTDTSPTPK